MRQVLAHPLVWPLAALLIAAVFRSPVLSLVLGAALALTWGSPRAGENGLLAKRMLQAAVVLLGFGVQLAVVLHVGASSFGITLVSILITLGLGFGLSRVFRVDRELATLISSGTAICGGSAIAAIAPAIGASAANTAVSLAVVFLLNAVALVIFPLVGQALHLTQNEFGLWSALAIHDTSSVVGAAAVYGAQALAVGTTVKLTRALWILPLSLGFARVHRSRSGAKIPWFLAGFVLAALLRSFFPEQKSLWNQLAAGGKFVMITTLFLIGTGLTRESLRRIGTGPLLLAVSLWFLVSVGSLLAIRLGWLRVDLPL